MSQENKIADTDLEKVKLKVNAHNSDSNQAAEGEASEIPSPISMESELGKLKIAELAFEETLAEYNNDLNTENYEDGPKSILFSMLKQITKGMDLHRVVFPTFVLEPRSMLERMTDFMTHPQLLYETSKKENSVDRFIDVVKYFLSGWHIRPKGVKKPYNPVLGEFFRCKWKSNNTHPSFYIAEQVSHHPPISAYFFTDMEHDIVAMGNFKPKSKFLGNSIVSIMSGSSFLYFTNIPDEEYVILNPNVYARGILFGTLCMEVGDLSTIRCEKNDLQAEIEFKTKGYFSGTYNGLSGKIKRISTGETIYTISGKWTDKLFITPIGCPTKSSVNTRASKKNKTSSENIELLFDANKTELLSKFVPKIECQNSMESRRLWQHVTTALLKRDYDEAAEEKEKIEEKQRLFAKIREEKGLQWASNYFSYDSLNDFWGFIERKQLLQPSERTHSFIRHFFNQNFK